jgi:AmmeMemoRadiSam system protein A
VLTPAERDHLREVAQDAVVARLTGRDYGVALPEDGPLTVPGSCFVTVYHRGRLRGCIGLMGDRFRLARCVRESAIRALEDPRFSALVAGDLEGLTLEISVLGPLTPLSDPADLEPGRHGVQVVLGMKSGLVLPTVAREQGWDRDRLLAEVCRKAALPPDAWRDPRAELWVFEAEVF